MSVLTMMSQADRSLDNASVVDFLTTTAGVLNQEGLLSRKEADSLRIGLREIQDHPGSRDEALLPALVARKSDFLSLLVARYGEARLGSNLLRYTMRPALRRLITAFSEWGKALLPVAEQSFNRPFHIYDGRDCESRTLYSGVLIYLADSLENTCQKLWQAEASGRCFFPHGMASGRDQDLLLDQKVAEGLGFTGLCFDPFPGISDRAMGHQIRQAIQQLTLILTEFVKSLEQNVTDLPSVSQVFMHTEWLLRESEVLIPVTPGYSSLAAWDMRRQQVLGGFGQVGSRVRELGGLFSMLVKEHQRAAFGAGTTPEGRDLRRRISSQMISGGTGAGHADRATKELFEYMHSNAVKPQELILGELNKINMALTPESLEILRDFCQNERLAKAPVMEKKRIFNRCQHLKKEFDRQISEAGKAGLLFLAVLLSGACGLKTSPKSSEPDLRPDIPFREGFYGESYFEEEAANLPPQDIGGGEGLKSGQQPADKKKTSVDGTTKGKTNEQQQP